MLDRPTTRRVLTVLWALRIYGPVGSAELARRVGESRRRVIDELTWLVGQGLASNTDPLGYDVTERGRIDLVKRPREWGFRWR